METNLVDLSAMQSGLWVVGGGLILNFAINAIRLHRMLRGDSEPRQVSFAQQFAMKSELDDLRSDMDSLERRFGAMSAEIKTDLKEYARDSEARASKIHQRVDAILAAVSEQKGRLAS